MPKAALSAGEFYQKHSGQIVTGIDDDGNEVTGKLVSISWRETLGLKLEQEQRRVVQVWYDPQAVRVGR